MRVKAGASVVPNKTIPDVKAVNHVNEVIESDFLVTNVLLVSLILASLYLHSSAAFALQRFAQQYSC